MDKEYVKRLAANPDFIPGIYNYCDRWCERCPFTARCMNYALGEEQFSEADARDIYNQVFWQRLTEAFQVTRELLEEALEEHGIDIHELDLDTVEQEEQLKHETADNHECSQAAKMYDEMVSNWFELAEELIKAKKEEILKHGPSEFSDDDTTEDVTGFEDALEIVCWYQKQIYVKIMRAITGKIDESTMTLDEDDDWPKDYDGSAKVALIGIDRSIAAWLALRKHLPEYKDAIIDFLVHLDRLRKKIEVSFPDARAFVRPGFDEVDLS
jgi:hypothetical protein